MSHYIRYPLYPSKYKTLTESLQLSRIQLRQYYHEMEQLYGPQWITEYLTRLNEEGQIYLKLHASLQKETAAYIASMLTAYYMHHAQLNPALTGSRQIEAFHLVNRTTAIIIPYQVQAYISFPL